MKGQKIWNKRSQKLKKIVLFKTYKTMEYWDSCNLFAACKRGAYFDEFDDFDKLHKKKKIYTSGKKNIKNFQIKKKKVENLNVCILN